MRVNRESVDGLQRLRVEFATRRDAEKAILQGSNFRGNSVLLEWSDYTDENANSEHISNDVDITET